MIGTSQRVEPSFEFTFDTYYYYYFKRFFIDKLKNAEADSQILRISQHAEARSE